MTKISEFPVASALDGTESVPVVQGGVTKKAPASEFGGGIVLRSAIGDGSAHRTTSSTSYVDLADMTLTIPAAVDDVLDISFAGPMQHSSLGLPIHVRLNVGGNDVGAGAFHTLPESNKSQMVSAQHAHTVVAGDISGGNVTVKVRWRVTSGTATALNESSADNRRSSLIVRNVGPQ